jgi:hypothetical protein
VVSFAAQRPRVNTRYRVAAADAHGSEDTVYVYPRTHVDFWSPSPGTRRWLVTATISPEARPRGSEVHFYLHRHGTASYDLMGSTPTSPASGGRLVASLRRDVAAGRRDRYLVCNREGYALGMGRDRMRLPACGQKSVQYPRGQANAE